MNQSELPSLPKPKRSWEAINQEYQAAAAQLGQANYTKAKLEAEQSNLQKRMFELELEAADTTKQPQSAQQTQAAPAQKKVKLTTAEKRAAAIAKAEAARAKRGPHS